MPSAVECPEGNWKVAYGYTIGSGHTYGESVTHQCNLGFIFPRRTLAIVSFCTASATWSRNPVHCEGIIIYENITEVNLSAFIF